MTTSVTLKLCLLTAATMTEGGMVRRDDAKTAVRCTENSMTSTETNKHCTITSFPLLILVHTVLLGH